MSFISSLSRRGAREKLEKLQQIADLLNVDEVLLALSSLSPSVCDSVNSDSLDCHGEGREGRLGGTRYSPAVKL